MRIVAGMSTVLAVVGVYWASGASAASSPSGADLLLRGTSKVQSTESPQTRTREDRGDSLPSVSEFRLNDPFSVQFYSAWQEYRSQLSPEVNHWAALILREQFEEASHLWGGIERQLPSVFTVHGHLAYFRALGRLGFGQALVEAWMDFLVQKPGVWISSSKVVPAVIAFEASWSKILEQPLDQFLFDRGFSAPTELQVSFSRLDPKSLPSIATLQAAGFLRKGDQGKALLEVLPSSNVYKLPLAQTVALAFAKRGDLAAAANTLKVHAEAAIEARQDLVKLSSHLLQIARFLFQAGLWEESETYFRKIPNGAAEFLSAREELAWVLLRRGDIGHLRGEIASLSTSGTQDAFHPEIPVVRAISNLKLCSFGGVQKDFDEFQSSYGAWARRVEAALSSVETPIPSSKDGFVLQAERRLERLTGEHQRLTQFYERSLQSGLPSVVGRQSHWKKWVDAMATRLEFSKKLVQSEYRRHWKNQKTLLSEAIRKMRFVKIELLHQMRVLASESQEMTVQSDAVALSQAAPRPQEGQIVFPLDGVLWPDEFFRIQSVVEKRCLKGLSK